MKKLQSIIISIFAVVGIALVPAVAVSAASPVDSIKQGVGDVSGGEEGDQGMTLQEGIKTIVDILLFILAAIAVIMIIIGGIRYTTSNGDANSTKGAKDTILYAVIGLVVAILAYAIVTFVLDVFLGGSEST